MRFYRVLARDDSYVVAEPSTWIGCGVTMAGAQAVVQSFRARGVFTYFDIQRWTVADAR